MPSPATPTILLVYCPCPSLQSAQGLARQLLETGLVACANLLAPMQSHYWWEGTLENAEEIPLLLKTLPKFQQETENFLKEHHPYDTPCILAWEATTTADFRKWVEESTKSIASRINMQ